MKSIHSYTRQIEYLDALIACAILDQDATRVMELNTVKIIQLKSFVEYLKGLVNQDETSI